MQRVKEKLLAFLKEDTEDDWHGQDKVQARIIETDPLRVTVDEKVFFDIGTLDEEIQEQLEDEDEEEAGIAKYIELIEWRFVVKNIPNCKGSYFDIIADSFR